MYGCLDHEPNTRANRCLFLTRRHCLAGQQEEQLLCPFLRRLLISVNEYIYSPDDIPEPLLGEGWPMPELPEGGEPGDMVVSDKARGPLFSLQMGLACLRLD